MAKGLLLRDDKKPIGEQGFFWLCISIASNWAGDAGRLDGFKTDKIPLEDRVRWTLANEDELMLYVMDPKENQGWMQAEKPWQFLAACIELAKVREWQDENFVGKPLQEWHTTGQYQYESHLECFIDGSNNGSQHLSALTRDEVTAPHVNLIPSDLPGDLYKYVAEHVWDAIKEDCAQLTETEIEECDEFIDDLIERKGKILAAPLKSEERNELILETIAYKKEHGELLKMASPVFWNRITDGKHKRKLSKR